MFLSMPLAQVDPVLAELWRYESQLQQWIGLCESHARWFAADPISALRAANLGISENILCELEDITSSIARKLSSEITG
jgi:hypothetical protein